MDSVTLIMFSFVLMIGFVFLILGFNELKETLEERRKGTPATPAMGMIYFIIAMIVWFVLAMYWAAMATDPALATMAYLWDGFAVMSLGMFWVCLGYVLKDSLTPSNTQGTLEIREEF